MAEIRNNATSAAQIAVRIQVLGKVQGEGMVSHGPVKLNAELGVARTRVSFWVGDREIFRNEVFIHQMSAKAWSEGVNALIRGALGPREEVNFGLESPELLMTARRSRPLMEGGAPYYELLIVLDAGTFDASGGIIGEGPAMFLTPKAEDLENFSSDLLKEVMAAVVA